VCVWVFLGVFGYATGDRGSIRMYICVFVCVNICVCRCLRVFVGVCVCFWVFVCAAGDKGRYCVLMCVFLVCVSAYVCGCVYATGNRGS